MRVNKTISDAFYNLIALLEHEAIRRANSEYGVAAQALEEWVENDLDDAMDRISERNYERYLNDV